MGNAIACATRWANAGLNLWKYAGLWGAKGCEERSMLGDEQWKWFENELLTSTADLNIVVSSVQIWTTNPAMESWGHFPRERENLWGLLKKHYSKDREGQKHPSPVMFWSGDVHHGEILGQQGYLEVTSSGMTHHCGQPKLYGHLCRPILENFKAHRHQPGEFYIGLNYGVLQVDWEALVATVKVKNSAGSTVLTVEQPLDQRIDLPEFDSIPSAWDGHLLDFLWRACFALILGFGIAKRLMRASTTPRQ